MHYGITPAYYFDMLAMGSHLLPEFLEDFLGDVESHYDKSIEILGQKIPMHFSICDAVTRSWFKMIKSHNVYR